MQKITINLRGSGINFKWRQLNSLEWLAVNARADAMLEKLEAAWFDLEFFPVKAGEAVIYSRDGFEIQQQISGILPDSKGIAEININGQRKSKFFIQALLTEPPLFPAYQIYQSAMQPINGEGRQLCEMETTIGLIQSFRLRVMEFDINKLSFHFTEVNSLQLTILSGLKYDSQPLTNKREDCLVTGQHLYIQ